MFKLEPTKFKQQVKWNNVSETVKQTFIAITVERQKLIPLDEDVEKIIDYLKKAKILELEDFGYLLKDKKDRDELDNPYIIKENGFLSGFLGGFLEKTYIVDKVSDTTLMLKSEDLREGFKKENLEAKSIIYRVEKKDGGKIE
ncbi:hypothetical protein [Virgibacillus sp. DJP39]|uniref:hypothetical protein n=1 Tax=Virgibacillus sp. DJP39 TaxID=3409790 RepID=UPI003BB6F9B9